MLLLVLAAMWLRQIRKSRDMDIIEHSLRMDVLRLSRENRILRRRCSILSGVAIPDDAVEREYYASRCDVSRLMAESRELDAVNAPLFTETEKSEKVSNETAGETGETGETGGVSPWKALGISRATYFRKQKSG